MGLRGLRAPGAPPLICSALRAGPLSRALGRRVGKLWVGVGMCV